MPTIAELDVNGVLIGYKTVSKEKHTTTSMQVAVPDECDLQPGDYYWNGQSFLPRTDDTIASEASPEAIHGIALGFAHLWNHGTELPDYTVQWLREYAESIDNARAPKVVLTR